MFDNGGPKALGGRFGLLPGLVVGLGGAGASSPFPLPAELTDVGDLIPAAYSFKFRVIVLISPIVVGEVTMRVLGEIGSSRTSLVGRDDFEDVVRRKDRR